jgi:hypothetical protein
MAAWRVEEGAPGDPKGRRLIACKPFQPGDVVLREEPYASVLYDDQMVTRCDCCLGPADSLLRCAGMPACTVDAPNLTHLSLGLRTCRAMLDSSLSS